MPPFPPSASVGSMDPDLVSLFNIIQSKHIYCLVAVLYAPKMVKVPIFILSKTNRVEVPTAAPAASPPSVTLFSDLK